MTAAAQQVGGSGIVSMATSLSQVSAHTMGVHLNSLVPLAN